VQESAEEVAASRREFHDKSIYYSLELNDFQYRKRSDLIENVLAYMYTQFSFFHQAYDVMKDIEPAMRELTTKLGEVRLMQIIIKFVMYICINVDSPGA
jgi:Arf-GAP/coiled-coil/ANK repeat/PH domain-containing protein